MKKVLMLILLLYSFTVFSADLKIISPNGGETYFFNKDFENIKWIADEEVGDVVIILYRNGIKLFDIAKVVKYVSGVRNQSFLWRYTPNIQEGKGYRVRIRSLKKLAINDFSDTDFSVKRK